MAGVGKAPSRTYVVRALKRGENARQIAEARGVCVRTVEGVIAQHALYPENYGLTRLSLLAVDLGVTRQAMGYRVTHGDLSIVYWGSIRCFNAFNVAKARALFAHPKRKDYPGWLKMDEAAKLCATSQGHLHRLITTDDERVSGVRHVRSQGVSGFSYLFHPADIPTLSRQLGRKAIPKRYTSRRTVPQMADALGVPESRLGQWARAGAPYVEDWHRRYWFDAAELKGWLASCGRKPRDLAALLARLDALIEADMLGRAA